MRVEQLSQLSSVVQCCLVSKKHSKTLGRRQAPQMPKQDLIAIDCGRALKDFELAERVRRLEQSDSNMNAKQSSSRIEL